MFNELALISPRAGALQWSPNGCKRKKQAKTRESSSDTGIIAAYLGKCGNSAQRTYSLNRLGGFGLKPMWRKGLRGATFAP